MISTLLFRMEILKILVDPFLLDLDIDGLNILDSIISRARENHWKYVDFLSSSRLSWRRTVVFSRLYLSIAKRDTI